MARTKQRTRLQDFIVTSGDEVHGEDGSTPVALIVRGGEDLSPGPGASGEFRGGDGTAGGTGEFRGGDGSSTAGGPGLFRGGDGVTMGGLGEFRAGNATAGPGGAALFSAGDGTVGGPLSLSAGDGSVGDGGDLSVIAGNGVSIGGDVAVVAGDGATAGSLALTAGTGASLGGPVSLAGGDNTGTSGDGGTITVTPGSATHASGIGDGGSLVLSKGTAAGSGSDGSIVIDYATWPAADGTSGQVLSTDGAGNLSWITGGGGGGESLAATLAIGNTTGGTDIEVTSGDAIQLSNTGGSIDDSSGTVTITTPAEDGITIVSTYALGSSPIVLDTTAGTGDITLSPGGDIALDYGTWPSADGTSGQVLTTDGAGTLSWTTPGGGVSDLQGAYDGGNTVVTTPTGGDFDVSGSEAVSLDSSSASNFTVDGADLTLSTTTSGDVNVSSAAIVDVDGAGVSIDATGAFSIDGGDTSNVSVTGADLTISTITTGNVFVTGADDVRISGGSSGFIGLDGPTDRDGTGFKFGTLGPVPALAASNPIMFTTAFPSGPALVITVTIQDTAAVPPGTPPPPYWVHSVGPSGFTVEFATLPSSTHVIHWTARQ